MLADLVRFFVINVMLTVSGNLGANVNSLNGQHLRVLVMEVYISLHALLITIYTISTFGYDYYNFYDSYDYYDYYHYYRYCDYFDCYYYCDY